MEVRLPERCRLARLSRKKNILLHIGVLLLLFLLFILHLLLLYLLCHIFLVVEETALFKIVLNKFTQT